MTSQLANMMPQQPIMKEMLFFVGVIGDTIHLHVG